VQLARDVLLGHPELCGNEHLPRRVHGRQAIIMAIHLRELLTELGIKITGPTSLYEDNAAAISISEDSNSHHKTMHFALKFYWVREQVMEGTIKLIKIATADQEADILTKPMLRTTFERFVRSFVADVADQVAERSHF
jgi:hypothetical protein